MFKILLFKFEITHKICFFQQSVSVVHDSSFTEWNKFEHCWQASKVNFKARVLDTLEQIRCKNKFICYDYCPTMRLDVQNGFAFFIYLYCQSANSVLYGGAEVRQDKKIVTFCFPPEVIFPFGKTGKLTSVFTRFYFFIFSSGENAFVFPKFKKFVHFGKLFQEDKIQFAREEK